MDRYLVGGSVRDKLLGIPSRDSDYLVLNTSSEELKQKGFLEVGKSFGIFLHPESKDEYALPRGKDLLEDLSHRDLTMNAMAIDSNGNLIDPFNGRLDIQNKILRYVSDSFSDDLIRIYRVMRFRAQFPEFKIADETLSLLKNLVKTPEFKEVHPERILGELKKALETKSPSLFFEGLREIGALGVIFPELDKLIGIPQNPTYHPEGDAWIHTMLVLDKSAELTDDLRVRYACLVHDLGKGKTPADVLPKHIGHESAGIELVKTLGKRLGVSNDWLESSIAVTRFHLKVHRLEEMKSSTIVRMFYELDAFRKPYLVRVLELACEADELGKLKSDDKSKSHLTEYFDLVKSVSSVDIDPSHSGKEIGEAIREERIRRLKFHLKSESSIE